MTLFVTFVAEPSFTCYRSHSTLHLPKSWSHSNYRIHD